jgi:hypothetical protein
MIPAAIQLFQTKRDTIMALPTLHDIGQQLDFNVVPSKPEVETNVERKKI